ncbi:MAG: DUF2179 domain-containing protein [Prevotellaceae bacterium]|jgi:uncharacterized protein YebE (UPF0316 family)|nr:DUF2179 domain-containing protein [Prevotellaceae bacterium]
MFDTLFNYPYLPFLVFFARIGDVTLGTMRIIFISKGKKYLAPVVGFFEVFIWILVISRILAVSHDWLCYIAYAGGYATGSLVGIWVEERLAIGTQLIRVYTKKAGKTLVAILNKEGFGATMSKGEGIEGEVHIVQTVVNRNTAAKVEKLITTFDPQVFYVIADVRAAQHGIFPDNSRLFKRWRIGK